jgi:hypothetical protein
MVALSRSMIKTLRKLANGPDTATRMRCVVPTLVALERRKLIRVETTFNSIAFPRKALAYITDAGMEWLRANKKIRIHRREPQSQSTGSVR